MDENYKETIEICQGMNEKYKKGIERCKNIKEKYKNCYELYLLIQKNAKKVLMTSTSRKIISLYGMFVPDPCFVLLDEYKGRITKNENKKDFKYYFDEKDRIILTERCPNGKLLELIFYFYSENKVEFVMYSLGGKRIVELGELNYVQGKVANALYNDLVSEKYLNTDAKDYSGSYEEFIFTYTGKETIVEKKSNVFNHILHPNELRIYTETFKIPNEKTQS